VPHTFLHLAACRLSFHEQLAYNVPEVSSLLRSVCNLYVYMLSRVSFYRGRQKTEMMKQQAFQDHVSHTLII
jgi:hypothetical protein